MENSWKPLFHELEHASKLRLLKTHFHTSDRQGNEAGKALKKWKEDLALRSRKKSTTKAIVMAPATGGGSEEDERKSEERITKTRRKITQKVPRTTYIKATTLETRPVPHMSDPIVQTSSDTELGGSQDQIRKNHPQPSPQKQNVPELHQGENSRTRKLGKRQEVGKSQ